jgi:hypothetical protein
VWQIHKRTTSRLPRADSLPQQGAKEVIRKFGQLA